MRQVPKERPIQGAAPNVAVDFRTVFETEFRFVVRTLRYLGIGPDDVHDVAHEVFLNVFRKLPDYDPERPLRPWLYSFAYHIAKDFRALVRHRYESHFDAIDSADPNPLAEDVLIQSETTRLALRALDKLDESERGVVVAHHLNELPIPEVADALGIPLATAYTILRRARIKFDRAVRRIALNEGVE